MKTLFAAGVATLGIALSVAVVAAGSGGPETVGFAPVGSTTQATTATDAVMTGTTGTTTTADVSGPCDELEHRSDARCAGAAPVVQGPAPTRDDSSGPCDEAEHRNDPRCTGAAPDRAGHGGDDRERQDENDGGHDDDNDDDRSGSNTGRH